MKTLFLIRHAKSSWDDIALPDKDRSLNDRGRRDAPKMGKRLAKRNVTPDLILSSPARRALTTAEIPRNLPDMPSTAVLVSATALNLPAFSAGLGCGILPDQ
jgi:phosphohistidine phosphatase